MSPPHPFDRFPVQSLSRQAELPVQRLFNRRKWAVAGKDNPRHSQVRMMLSACTKRRRTLFDNVASQVSIKILFILETFGAQQLSPNKRQPTFLHDEAGQPAIRYLSLIHISEPTRQAEISYAVFCLKK